MRAAPPLLTFAQRGIPTRIVRSHTLRFGAEYRVYQENVYNLGQSSGVISYDAAWTRGPLDTFAAAPIGQAMAAFGAQREVVRNAVLS
ncbi:MAG: hypothetical protein HUU41_12655 [Bryobacteraceae bacterium]|nr:hypothetical protein [Bryobacterales bacterium]MEB2361911.1 hypothetical protein [Bryobacterales bacterium]NUN01958.1 hypothetical protein [Bryobacteraceae bacterium]